MKEYEIVRDAQVLHDENVGCVLPLAVELLALELQSNHEFVHRHDRQPEDRRDLVAEVKSSFAVQIKAWHARAAGRRQVAKALGLDATTEALGGLTPELGCFCDEPAARKSIEKRSKKQMCLYTSDLATASCNTERYHVQNILFCVAPKLLRGRN